MTRPFASPLVPQADDAFPGYDAFYVRHYRALVAHVRTTFPGVDAEAVAQEAFVRALTHWSRLDGGGSRWPWLAVTARNLACNQLREEGRFQSRGLSVFGLQERSPEDVPGEVEAMERLRHLAKAMVVLTPMQRQMVRVMVEEGLSGSELATRLGMRPGTCRMNLARLRSALGELLVPPGGSLAVLPVAAAAFARWVSRARRAATNAVPVSALTVLSFSGAAMVLGLVAPRPVGPPVTLHDEAGVVRLTPASAPALAAPRPVGRGTTTATGGARAAQAPPAAVTQVVAPVYHARLDPSGRPGRKVDIGVSVETPAGTVHAEVPVDQQGYAPYVPCLGPVGC